jgi:hypothetical protein
MTLVVQIGAGIALGHVIVMVITALTMYYWMFN